LTSIDQAHEATKRLVRYIEEHALIRRVPLSV
jgi:hypothetical protein